MMRIQLHCRDLAPGDVLIEVSSGSILSRALESSDVTEEDVAAAAVRTGILSDPTVIIEAEGAAITANDLRIRNFPRAYIVFRCVRSPLAAAAAKCARSLSDLYARGRGTASAGVAGDAIPLTGLLARVLEAHNQRFLGSQLVVYVFDFVSRQLEIPEPTFLTGGDAKASPPFLARALARNPIFQQVGYLPAGRR